ncbi:hypothetical protein ACFVQ3_14490 [Oerskovia sp. NPDC057915]|uniref:hypothetical protein n=1 Tax=Oerskovia sp. NPDC057915 TaxID=3346280 RepID=UPI0036DE6E7F
MWVDAERVSHTIAIEDGRDRVDAAVLNWIEGLEEGEVQILEDGLDGIQDDVFEEIENLPSVPFGLEGQELPFGFLIGAGLDEVSIPNLLICIGNVDLIWRLDVIELVADLIGEGPGIR